MSLLTKGQGGLWDRSQSRFSVFCHSGLDPESSDFAILLYDNKELRTGKFRTFKSLDAGFRRHDLSIIFEIRSIHIRLITD